MAVTTTIVYQTAHVEVRIVTVPAGEKLFLQRHADKHSLALPLEHLEHDLPFPVLVQYLLHHTPPRDYYSLYNSSNTGEAESFVHILWDKK